MSDTFNLNFLFSPINKPIVLNAPPKIIYRESEPDIEKLIQNNPREAWTQRLQEELQEDEYFYGKQ
jgi:hypothetical protein